MHQLLSTKWTPERLRHNSAMFVLPNIRIGHLYQAINQAVATSTKASATNRAITRIGIAGTSFSDRTMTALLGRWAIWGAMTITLKAGAIIKNFTQATATTLAQADFGGLECRHSKIICPQQA
jgi:hypothetical protein